MSLITSFLVVMSIRNNWTYKWQKRFNDAVGDYLINEVQTNFDNYHDVTFERKDAYASYFKMMAMFWVWDYKKFIYDYRVYDRLNLELK